MTTKYSIFIIWIIIVLLSGCSKKELKDSIARSIYMTLQSVSNDRNQENLYETNVQQQGYDDYKREREMMLKEETITDEQRKFNANLYMSIESTQEEVSFEVNCLNRID